MSSTLAPADSLSTELDRPGSAVVLDTNAVLDWLVFHDPSCVPLTRAFEGGRLHWLASPAMQEELAHVLSRGTLDAWTPSLEAVWTAWRRFARMVEPMAPCGGSARMRCSDADDQKFIDLAVSHHARWLLTRDRAVLRLARHARALGLAILTPAQWLATFDSR